MYDPEWKDYRIKPMNIQMRVHHIDTVFELCRRRKMPFNIVIERILDDYFTNNPIEELTYNEWNNEGERGAF